MSPNQLHVLILVLLVTMNAAAALLPSIGLSRIAGRQWGTFPQAKTEDRSPAIHRTTPDGQSTAASWETSSEASGARRLHLLKGGGMLTPRSRSWMAGFHSEVGRTSGSCSSTPSDTPQVASRIFMRGHISSVYRKSTTYL